MTSRSCSWRSLRPGSRRHCSPRPGRWASSRPPMTSTIRPSPPWGTAPPARTRPAGRTPCSLTAFAAMPCKALNLEKAWLLLSMNPSTGSGGPATATPAAPTSSAGWRATCSRRSPSPGTRGAGPPTRPTGWTPQGPGLPRRLSHAPLNQPRSFAGQRRWPREGDLASSAQRSGLIVHGVHPFMPTTARRERGSDMQFSP
jgi:hypothetical protein